jgi:uncharacterized protein (DUF3084 family)
MIINRIPEAPVGICVTFDDHAEVPIEVDTRVSTKRASISGCRSVPRHCREASSRATTWTSCQSTPLSDSSSMSPYDRLRIDGKNSDQHACVA